MISQHPLLWILTSANLSMKQTISQFVTVIVLPNMVCFRKFAFRLLKISIVAQARAENHSQNILQKSAKTPIPFAELEHPRSEMKNCLFIPLGNNSFQK